MRRNAARSDGLTEAEKIDHPHQGDLMAPIGSVLLEAWPLAVAPFDSVAAEAFRQMEAHLRHGRDGLPWCRWAVQALDGGTFLVADACALGGRAFNELIALTADAFIKRCPPPSADAVANRTAMDTLTVLLRDNLPLDEAEEALQGQRVTLLRRGLMAGLLHPQSTLRPLTPGPDGMPYQAGHPFLTVRWAVPGDEVFVGVNPELRSLLQTWIGRQQTGKEGST